MSTLTVIDSIGVWGLMGWFRLRLYILGGRMLVMKGLEVMTLNSFLCVLLPSATN